MATTTKSKKSSVKPKTTKKPVKTVSAKATKTTKKVAPAKVATKTTKSASKAVAKPAKVARVPRTLTAAVLRKWHLLSALVFAGLAVATGFVAAASNHQITLSHVTKDELATGTGTTVLAPAAHVIMDCDIRWALIAVLAVSALFAILRATRWQTKEEKGLAARVLPLRWLEFAVTFAALTGVVAMLVGVEDLIAVKLLGLTIVASFFFAWLTEREVANANKQSKLFGMTGALVGLVPWLFISLVLLGTYNFGIVNYPWFVYAAAAVLFLGQVLIAKEQKRAMDPAKAPKNYLTVERNYIVLNLLTKAAFAAVLILGLAK